MINEYENYVTNLGIPHTCSILTGIPKDKISGVKSIAYHNGADILSLESVPESNGYEWRMKFLTDNYKGKRIIELATENGYASYGYELNLNENLDEKLDQKLRDYIY